MRVGRDAAADAVFLTSGSVQCVFGLLVLHVKDSCLKRSRQIGKVNRAPGLGLLLDVERHRRLEARKREAVVPPAVKRTGEIDRLGVARLGQLRDDGATGIAQAQRLGHLVEGLAHGVVERLTEHLVVAPCLYVHEHGVPARDKREDERRLEVGLR